MVDRNLEIAASHWDAIASAEAKGIAVRWWESDLLREIVDQNWLPLTGSHNTFEFIAKYSGRSFFDTAISIGCGTAEEELTLVGMGLIGNLILADISSEQLKKARDFAQAQGIDESRLEFRSLVDLSQPFPGKVDLFYWRSSLHHMPDTRQALEWCRDNLRDGGAIYCNDACPPNYMQWGPEVLDWVELFRKSLPDRYMVDPYHAASRAPFRPELPDVAYWQEIDPSECADSARIIPTLREIAPGGKIVPLGGCIYSLALEEIINNFRGDGDALILRNAMKLDGYLSGIGHNYYFACLINQRDFLLPC